MTSIILRFILMATLFASSLSFADKSDSNPNPTNSSSKKAVPTKLAFVNISKIITLDPKLLPNASKEWQASFDELQKTIGPVDQELKALEDDFSKGRSSFESLHKSGVASQEALQRKYEEVAKLEMDLRKRYQERDQFYQAEVNKYQAKLAPKVEQEVKVIRAEQGWDMVLRGELVIDSSNTFDLTQEVLTRLDKKYVQEQEAKKAATQKNSPKADAKKA